MRAKGTVEVYREGIVIGGENVKKISDTKNTWTHLRIDVFGNRIGVWLNGELYLDLRDNTINKKGYTYLHTFGTHAQFRNFRIYDIRRWGHFPHT